MNAIEELLEDIRARTKEILFHHRSPIQSRHGRTSPICEDILTRCDQALTLSRAECVWKKRPWPSTTYDTGCGNATDMGPIGRIETCPFKDCGKRIKEEK